MNIKVFNLIGSKSPTQDGKHAVGEQSTTQPPIVGVSPQESSDTKKKSFHTVLQEVASESSTRETDQSLTPRNVSVELTNRESEGEQRGESELTLPSEWLAAIPAGDRIQEQLNPQYSSGKTNALSAGVSLESGQDARQTTGGGQADSVAEEGHVNTTVVTRPRPLSSDSQERAQASSNSASTTHAIVGGQVVGSAADKVLPIEGGLRLAESRVVATGQPLVVQETLSLQIQPVSEVARMNAENVAARFAGNFAESVEAPKQVDVLSSGDLSGDPSVRRAGHLVNRSVVQASVGKGTVVKQPETTGANPAQSGSSFAASNLDPLASEAKIIRQEVPTLGSPTEASGSLKGNQITVGAGLQDGQAQEALVVPGESNEARLVVSPQIDTTSPLEQNPDSFVRPVAESPVEAGNAQAAPGVIQGSPQTPVGDIVANSENASPYFTSAHLAASLAATRGNTRRSDASESSNQAINTVSASSVHGNVESSNTNPSLPGLNGSSAQGTPETMEAASAPLAVVGPALPGDRSDLEQQLEPDLVGVQAKADSKGVGEIGQSYQGNQYLDRPTTPSDSAHLSQEDLLGQAKGTQALTRVPGIRNEGQFEGDAIEEPAVPKGPEQNREALSTREVQEVLRDFQLVQGGREDAASTNDASNVWRGQVLEANSSSAEQPSSNVTQNGLEQIKAPEVSGDASSVSSSTTSAAAKSATATSSLRTDGAQAPISRQLEQPLREQIIQERDGSLKVELHPKELGYVTISIKQSADGLAAQFQTQQQATAELLITQEQDLKEFLADFGFDDVNVDVSHEDSNEEEREDSLPNGVHAQQTEKGEAPRDESSANLNLIV